MSASPTSRRAVAEINFGEGQSAAFNLGSRSIHQFWHLFSSHFRGVLLTPQRRPDSGKIAWTWREKAEDNPLTAAELTDVRRRLTEGNRLLTGGGAGRGLVDDSPGGNLDAQVREKAGEMVAQLIAKGDAALAGFVCRTETGVMVHSWGAATPARPQFPGTSEGGVAGTVLLGDNRAAGLTVVLENRQGGFVARTKSNESGAFNFQNVAPGAYRVRVTGRGDFPASGLAVTMERESITGLELRGKAAADGAAPASVTTPPMTADAEPRKRRFLIWLPLFAVLAGVGLYFWRSARQAAGTAAENNHPAGWQSASGKAAGTGGPAADSAKSPAGEDAGFSDLTPARAMPKAPSSPGKGETTPDLQARELSASPDETNRNVPRGPKPPAGATAPNSGKLDSTSKAGTASTSSADSHTPEPTDQLAALLPGPDGTSSSTPSRQKTAKITKPASAATSAPAGASPSGSSSGTDSAASGRVGTAAASSPASATGTPATGKNPAGPGPSESSPAADSAHAPAPSDAAASDPAAAPAGHPASAPRSAPPLKTPAAEKNPDATAADASTAPGPKPEDVEKSAEKDPAKSAPPTVRKAGSSASATTTDGPAADTPAETAEPAQPATGDKSPAPAKSPAKKSPKANDRPSPSEPTDAPADATVQASPAPASLAATGNNLPRHAQVDASAWKPRQVQDLVLPTQPVLAEEEEAVDALREKLRQEQRARMPRIFQQPEITNGFAVEFVPDQSGNLPHWRDVTGAADVPGGTVLGNRAEIAWPGNAPQAGNIVLSYADGREIARITAKDGASTGLQTAAGVRGWYWIGIKAAAGNADPASGQPAVRLVWRRLSGAAMPASWIQDDHWLGGQGYRLDLPLQFDSAEPVPGSIALVDPSTGWALVSEIKVR